ncbi:glycosyltransferase [Listeria booriae]|uniref:Glycosyltransferase n=1 Tax=Listeria booriae TaxID=1552123 RepID=A0A7X0XEP9_9LIST|nr:glycosyltransferase [Listeria booriae]MBC1492849.1 glycosyltransferase [Listeria booriae]
MRGRYDNQLVSIIMPCFNAMNVIGDSIDSVLAQTYVNWELIIVDDASADQSLATIEPYLTDPRIQLLAKEKNEGVALARNDGLARSTGRYVAFLDSDDLWRPRKLEQQLTALTEKDAVLSYSAYETFQESPLKMLCDKMGIDIWETIEASSTKPFGFMRFNPGPGIGGHCIPLDPIYLSWKAKEANFFSRFIELAQETNSQMPDYIVHKAVTALNTVKKSLNGSTILLIGMAYKENIDDLRESPSIPIFESLQAQGVMVSFCDPLATDFRSKDGATHHTIPLDYAQMAHYDLVITLTCHDLFDKDKMAEHSRLILDTKNAFAHIDSRKIVRFGDATFQIANEATHVSL